MGSKSDGLALLRCESVQIALVVVFALAVYLPSHRSHWLRIAEGDESGQVEVSEQSLHHVVTTYQSGQNHPLYGILAHFSMQVLPLAPIYAARLPALLAGVLIPVAFYYTHRRWAGRAAALLVACVLVAADPLHYYASAARGYTLMVLFVLLANDLLLRYLRGGRPAVLATYTIAATAAGYSHLWGALILPAHAVYLAIDPLWHRFCRLPVGAGVPTPPTAGTAGLPDTQTSGPAGGSVWRAATRHLYAGAGIAAAAVLILLLYCPMLPEIRAMAGHRSEAPLGLADKVLGLVSFRSWTTAAYVLLAPIALEGCARRLKHEWPDRAVWLHVTVVLCVLSVTTITQPANFYRRFLMVIIPSIAALAAWAFAGAVGQGAKGRRSRWGEGERGRGGEGERGSRALGEDVASPMAASLDPSAPRPLTRDPRRRTPNLLPVPATWLAGFALGVLVSNTSMSSFMSWQYGANTTFTGRDQGYYYRNLPKAVESIGRPLMPGFPVAGALLVVAAVVIGWRLRRSSVASIPNRRIAYLAIYFWTGLLLAGLAPLILGPAFTEAQPWLFELHTIAAATLCLLAWQYREDRRLLRALRYGLLLSALVLVYWQCGVEHPRLGGSALLRCASLVPPVLFTVTLFANTEPG